MGRGATEREVLSLVGDQSSGMVDVRPDKFKTANSMFPWGHGHIRFEATRSLERNSSHNRDRSRVEKTEAKMHCSPHVWSTTSTATAFSVVVNRYPLCTVHRYRWIDLGFSEIGKTHPEEGGRAARTSEDRTGIQKGRAGDTRSIPRELGSKSPRRYLYNISAYRAAITSPPYPCLNIQNLWSSRYQHALQLGSQWW